MLSAVRTMRYICGPVRLRSGILLLATRALATSSTLAWRDPMLSYHKAASQLPINAFPQLARPKYCSGACAARRLCRNLCSMPAGNGGKFADAECNETEEKKIPCWDCNTKLCPVAIFCDRKACRVLQPPHSSVNFFKLMQMQPSFDLNLPILENRYRSLQKVLHPDHFSARSKKEQEFSAAHSSRVNEAFSTLKDPYLRSKYLLYIRGYPFDENEQVTDQNLLTEILDVREAVAEASSLPTLNELFKKNQSKLQVTEKALSRAFATNDLKAAKDHTARLSYFRTIDQELRVRMPPR